MQKFRPNGQWRWSRQQAGRSGPRSEVRAWIGVLSLACLFIAVTAAPAQVTSRAPVSIGNEDTDQLAARLKAMPTQTDADRAAEILSYSTTSSLSVLEGALRGTLTNIASRDIALHALANHPALQFDADIALLLPSPTTPTPDPSMELLLEAAGTSGASATATVLEQLGRDRSPIIVPFHIKIWRALFKLDSMRATAAALSYYGSGFALPQILPSPGMPPPMPPGSFELRESSATAQMLIGFLNELGDDRENLIRLLPVFHRFLSGTERGGGAFGPGIPAASTVKMLQLAPVGSPNYTVAQKIENILVALHSPVALSELLRFTMADDPVLRDVARNADYQWLSRAPWLLPEESFVFRTKWDTASEAWKVISRYEIGVPMRVPVLHYSQFRELSGFEAKRRETNRPPPSATEKPRSVGESRRDETETATAMVLDIMQEYQLGNTSTLAMKYSAAMQPPVAGQEFAFVAVDNVENQVKDSLTFLLEQQGRTHAAADKLARFLVRKELERRALVLYALVAARRKVSNNGRHKLDYLYDNGEPPTVITGNTNAMLRARMVGLTRAISKARSSSPASYLATLDKDLDYYSTNELVARLLPDVIHSTVVTDVTDATTAATTTTAAAALASTGFTATVLHREFSFAPDLYREELLLRSDEGKEQHLTWVGPIPLALIVPLRRHPRLLDFAGVSLALREIRAETLHAPPVMDDIDYIRLDPVRSIPLLFLAATNLARSAGRDVPWQYVRDTLVSLTGGVEGTGTLTTGPAPFLEAAFHTNYFLPVSVIAAKPAPSISLTGLPEEATTLVAQGMPAGEPMFQGNIVMASDKEFDYRKDLLLKPLEFLLKYRVGRLAAEKARPTVEGLPKYKRPHPLDILSQLGLLHTDNPLRVNALSNLDSTIQQGNRMDSYLSRWDLSDIDVSTVCGVQLRQMLLRPDYSEAFATYEITTTSGSVRYLNMDSKISPVPEVLRFVLRQDPQFLNRYSIDLGNATEQADARFAVAAQRLVRKAAGPLPAVALLNRLGFYALAPDLEGLSPDQYHEMYDQSPDSILFRTADGRFRAVEMDTVSSIFKVAVGSVLPETGPPTKAFKETVLRTKSSIVGLTATLSQEKADRFTQTIRSFQQDQDNVVVSINVSFSEVGVAPVVGGGISVNGIGIDLATSFQNNVIVSGIINGQTLSLFSAEFLRAETPPMTNLPSMADVPLGELERDIADEKLVSTLSRLTSEGTGYVTQFVTTPTAHINTLAERVDSASTKPPPQQTQMTMTWNAFPPIVGPGPWQNSAFSERMPLYGNFMLKAMTQMTPDEQRAISEAVRMRMIPQPMANFLVEKYKQSVEQERIRKRQWMKVAVVSVLLPNTVAGHPVTEESRAGQIYVYNGRAKNDFQTAVDKEIKNRDDKKIFLDGMPAVSITYGNDYTLMRTEYHYLLAASGKEIIRFQLTKVPSYLVDILRQNHGGHIYEMLMATAADGYFQSLPAYSKLLEAEAGILYEGKAVTLKEQLKTIVDDRLMSLGDVLLEAIKKYIQDLKDWAERQSIGDMVAEPFEPAPEGTPMLNFFPSPYEWGQRRDESVDQVLTSERATEWGRYLRSGHVKVKMPAPNIP